MESFTFEKWTESYIPDLIKNADNPMVAANLRDIFPNPYTEEAAQTWIKICADADEATDFNRAIIVDNRAVGGIGLTLGRDVYRKSAELGLLARRRLLGSRHYDICCESLLPLRF